VLFVHGLESSPGGAKARFLARHFTALTPGMNTRDFEGCCAIQARAIRDFEPDVVVGSSFGGAVVLRLLGDGLWRGPSVLLAQAGRHFGVAEILPDDTAVTIVHGTRDDVVDIAGSRALARTGTPGLVVLQERDDDHRLQTLLEDGSLASIVMTTFERSKKGQGGPR
jgi:hypothetical protein